ncbi:DUF3047 domain-containing protein [Spongiibacter tropicus]|uniref:DUF3047 domain-containing protein n=2 Tax=Spongiibacter tropicus TaxID=454602 RepID=UPI0035BE75AF
MARYRLHSLYQRMGLIGAPGAVTAQGMPSPLSVLLRFIASRLRRGKSVASNDFSTRVMRLAAELEIDVPEPMTLVGGELRWHSTGVQCQAGDRVMLLACGRLYLSRALDVGLGPNSALWYRFGEGKVQKAVSEATILTADCDGELQLIAVAPGDFATTTGDIDEVAQPPLPLTGTMAVIPVPALADAELLAKARQSAPELFTDVAEVQPLPEGWKDLWRMGQGRIFSTNGCGEISCRTRGDVGIVQYPVDLPLDDALTLNWSWMAESLPSNLPENIQATHDYLSIAVEFDNGLDLTYMWSTELAVDTIFQCPLPWWDQRETHWVLRNDPEKLGHWLQERRSLLADYRRAIGGEQPERVVAVWLIANSVFQRGEGRCRYRDIGFDNADGHHPVWTVAQGATESVC